MLPAPTQPSVAIPRDDYLVALADTSNAEAIITGDLDLLAIDPSQLAVEILTPRQFADRLS
jgi:predicted nucleic acid-binding protein